MMRDRKAGNAYARGKRVAIAESTGSTFTGNPFPGDPKGPHRAEHVAWARGYENTRRAIIQRENNGEGV